MLKLQLSLMGVVLCLITCSAITPPKDLYAKTISTKLTRTTKNYAGTYPQVTNHGNPATWVLISPASWTSGFFPATMYELHRRQTLCPSHSDGVNWLTRGRKWSDAVLAMSNGNNQGHDQGFLSFPFVEELKMSVVSAQISFICVTNLHHFVQQPEEHNRHKRREQICENFGFSLQSDCQVHSLVEYGIVARRF